MFGCRGIFQRIRHWPWMVRWHLQSANVFLFLIIQNEKWIDERLAPD